jgi:hypothetical protein
MTATGQTTGILLPADGAARRRYVDFVFALDYLSINSPLIKIMHEAMAAYGLSVLLVNSTNVERSVEAVRKGRLDPLVYLDLCARPGDPFSALLQAMAAAGVHTLCDPKVLPWTIKAYSHPALEKAGLPLPPTVILGKDDPDRDLTPDEMARLGDRCVIKPSYGVAGLGAVIGVTPDRQQVAKAREYNRGDDWLIQRMIRWGTLGDRPAYLRGYNVLGHRTLMWWSNDKGYARLTWDDFRKYDLGGAVELVDRLAAITGLEFFSTEIAITAESGADRYCLIDYVNDQCDIDPQADAHRSPPRSWVRWVCHRLAELTWREKHDLPPAGEGTLHLGDGAAA